MAAARIHRLFNRRFEIKQIEQMTDSKEGQQVELILKLVSVKMKIKFPCRMALEYNKQLITAEVSPKQPNKFVFNEDITLKAEADSQNYQIMANLYTDKGTRYTSGIIKLIAGELIRSQGQRLIIPITKCLDPDAFCEIKIQQVNSVSRSMLRISKSNSKILNSPQKPEGFTSQLKKINSDRYLIAQTRSEIHSPLILYPNSQENRSRDVAKTQIFKSFANSPGSKFSSNKYINLMNNQSKIKSEFPVEEVISQRQTFAESEVIREGYQKLKQKYKKQSELAKEESHKRILLEANQNNYKLQIMKLKLKCEGQEKEINDKNQKIRSINAQLNQLQRKDTDMAYLREECSALQNKVAIHQDTIQALTAQNETLKKLMNEKQKTKDQTISQLKHELEFALAKIEENKHELELQVKTKDAIIFGKNNDLKMRSDTIQRQKKMIKELEDQAESKLFQFQKTLTAEKNSLQLKIDEIKQRGSALQKQKGEMQAIIIKLTEDIEKHKSFYTALEYSKKLQSQEIASLNTQIQQFKRVKEKYNQLQKEYKFLQEQFATVRRSLELALQNKEVNLNDLISKYDENKQRYDKNKLQYQERIKTFILKSQEADIKAQIAKTTIEKNNRTIESLTKEVAALKKQSTSLRDELKIAQKRIISLESDHSTNFSKYQRQTANFRFLLDKYKDEKQAFEKEIDILRQKVDKLQQTKTQFERKQSGWKLRQRHFQEKIEKETVKYRQTLSKYESINKEQESSIYQLNLKIESLTSDILKQRKRINEYDLAEIRTREKEERTKKEIKFYQQKIVTLQSQIKTKIEDLGLQTQKNRQFEFKIAEKEVQVSKIKENLIQERNKLAKQLQITQILKKDIAKGNQIIVELQNTIIAKQKQEESLRNDLKNSREETAKEKMKFNKIETDFQKFKDTINDIIRIEFTRILSNPNTQRTVEKLRESQVSISRSDKTERSRVKCSLDAGQLASTLSEKLHQTKNSLWKMAELNRLLKGENVKLLQEVQSASNKHEFEKLEYHRDIQQLEDEMNLIVDDKEAEVQNYDNLVIDLNAKIKEKQLTIEEMRIQIDEYNAIITGLRTDFETNNDLNQKKVNSLKSTISELNQRIEYLNLNVACLEDKNHQLQEKTIQLENQVISHKELLIRNEKATIDAKENQANLKKNLQDLKKSFKSLQQEKQQIEIQLSTEKEVKEKYIFLLEQQQKKSQKLSQFISSLILQKQTAIKNELQRSEQVNSLENKLFQSNQANEILKEDNQALRKKNDELKQQTKTLNKSFKALQKQLSEERVKNSKHLERIKQKESDIDIKKEYIKDLEEKYREMRDKNYKEIKDLSNELEDKNVSSFTISKQLTEKVVKLENQTKILWEDKVALKSELEAMNHELHSRDDALQDQNIKIKKLEEEKINLEDQIASKEFIIHQRVQEIKRLEQTIQEQRLSLNKINSEFEVYQQQFDLNIKELTNDYNFKIETLSKEYGQKLELERKQYEFVREKLSPLEEELNKALLQKKSQEIQSQQIKRLYEQKLKKLESERLQGILSKNNEIKLLSEESKAQLSKLHEKDSEIRKISLELQQLKLSTGRTQQYYTYSLQQSKNQVKVLQKQIEGWKAKEQHTLNFKQRLLASLYQNQVQVRKILAGAIKNIMENWKEKDFDRISLNLKGLESSVVDAMMAKIDAV